MANSARTMAAESVSMCPASASSAKLPEITEPMTSTNMNPPINARAMIRTRLLAPRRSW